ncbi:MAG: hypothetical protein R3F19_12190 [Verrucomicrobiales bacterium]
MNTPTSRTSPRAKPNKNNASFDIDEGSPTLTFVTADEALAIPYHTLHHMRIAKDARSICFAFDEFEVILVGLHLLTLWRELQGYNVREVRLAQGAAQKALETENPDTVIRSILIKVLNEEPEEEIDGE